LAGAPPALHKASCDGFVDHWVQPGQPSRGCEINSAGLGRRSVLDARSCMCPHRDEGANTAYEALMDVDDA
jgi:hypothetical protein